MRKFIKTWILTSGFFFLISIPKIFSGEDILDIAYDIFSVFFLGFSFGTIVFALKRLKIPTPKTTKDSSEKKNREYFVCPFCQSSRLGERQVTVDNSSSNAMAGYMAFGKPGLIFGAMPDEVHTFLICYDCANEFSYEEALVAQEHKVG